MGLDIYLKRSKDRAAAIAAQDAAENEVNALWEADSRKYDEYSEDEKDAIRAKSTEIRAKYGCDDWGSSKDIETVEIASENYPEHMFKVGYLRSSYNSGGINSVLNRAGCMDLYEIFEPGDEYYFTPDWEKCSARAEMAITEYEKFLGSDAGKFQVMHISDIGVGGAKDEIHALNIFMETQGKERSPGWNSFSNRDGNFFLEGINIRAVIRNDADGWKSGGCYLIVDKDPMPEGEQDWYLTALKITKEMIDYVLAQPDKDNYFLSWSA